MDPSCAIFSAGSCRTLESVVEPGGRWRLVPVPALFALIEHPQRGPVLFDTGYAPRYYAATRRLPYRLYRLAAPAQIDAGQTAAAQLQRRGIQPADVGWVIVSHFDPDHIGGLADFPSARVVCSRRAWQWVSGGEGPLSLRLRVLPHHLPPELDRRLHLVDEPDGPAVGGIFPATDLFGDGSIRLVALPGHAPGQLGALLQLGDGRRLFLVADACYSRAALASDRPDRSGIQRLIAHDWSTQVETWRRLQRLHARCPEIAIVPSHCRQAAAELVVRDGGG